MKKPTVKAAAAKKAAPAKSTAAKAKASAKKAEAPKKAPAKKAAAPKKSSAAGKRDTAKKVKQWNDEMKHRLMRLCGRP